MNWTREHLRRLNMKPNGRGGVIHMPAEEWHAKHAQATEPKPKTMTQVEDRWFTELEYRYPQATIIPQFRVRCSEWDAVTPTHYTADFAIFSAHPEAPTFHQCVLWEVKDTRRHPHSDELVRAKIARKSNPWISAVHLAAWDGSAWNERRLA